MKHLLIFLLTFTIVFFVMLVIYLKKKRCGELKKSKEIMILVYRFRLNSKKINYDALSLVFVLINSLIIAITGTIATAIYLAFVWQMMIGFITLMILISSSYALVGVYLKRKETRK